MYIKDIQVDILKDMCRVIPKHRIYFEKESEYATFVCVDGFLFHVFPEDLLFLDTKKMKEIPGNVIAKNIQEVQNDEETLKYKGEIEVVSNRGKKQELMKLYHTENDVVTYVDRALTKYFNFGHPNVRLSTKRASNVSCVLVYESGQLVGGVLPCRHTETSEA